MKNKFMIAKLIFGLFISWSLSFSCSVPSNEISSQTMEGYWKSSYGDGFEIKDNKFFQYDDVSKTVSFSGDIVNSPAFDGSKGYITVKIKNPGTWNYPVDNFTVISWINFNGSECKESTPYKAGSVSFMTDRIAAEFEYTIENGYYEAYGIYLKQ